MPITDPRIDAYIAKSAGFAKPILTHFRRLVHAACPDVEETIKWGFPHFQYRGMLCAIAAFKAHCAIVFWKRKLIFKDGNPEGAGGEALGQFGRLTSLADLPRDEVMLGYLKTAVRLNEAGVTLPPRSTKKRTPLVIPPWFNAALKKNKKALAAFTAFSYSHQKEYVEWLTGAKTDETRQRRLATALQWLAQGKSRHWKYQNC